jgi:hypothetical protein
MDFSHYLFSRQGHLLGNSRTSVTCGKRHTAGSQRCRASFHNARPKTDFVYLASRGIHFHRANLPQQSRLVNKFTDKSSGLLVIEQPSLCAARQVRKDHIGFLDYIFI